MCLGICLPKFFKAFFCLQGLLYLCFIPDKIGYFLLLKKSINKNITEDRSYINDLKLKGFRGYLNSTKINFGAPTLY